MVLSISHSPQAGLVVTNASTGAILEKPEVIDLVAHNAPKKLFLTGEWSHVLPVLTFIKNEVADSFPTWIPASDLRILADVEAFGVASEFSY